MPNDRDWGAKRTSNLEAGKARFVGLEEVTFLESFLPKSFQQEEIRFGSLRTLGPRWVNTK